ncbi:MAG TPA: hypothetical protein PK228_00665, partial [Saprospiraceae bacterium]|nr:hypothetical protein [Saprospiraceae bacterium]
YLWLVFSKKDRPKAETRWYVALGIALRVLLLFSIPNLSDDVYRFLWDGHLTVAGIHPFAHPPVYFIENQIFPPGITPALFAKLNSPGYFTVYPPVCQAVFALAAWLGQESTWAGVFVMKLFLLGCEVGTIWLLGIRDWGLVGGSGSRQWQIKETSSSSQSPIPNPQSPIPTPQYLISNPQSPIPTPQYLISNPQSPIPTPQLIYALNPLILLEITGNCHFEGAMIFFLLAGLWALERNRVKQAALWWALATAAKLLPLMFVPIVWRWLGWRKGLVFNTVFAGACMILFAPLLSVLPNILSSLDLYFQKFQFNASVYYLLRELGFWIKGYDIGESLGPVLGLATVVGVLWLNPTPSPSPTGRGDVESTATSSVMSSTERSTAPLPVGEGLGVGLNHALLLALLLQLSLSATVHPWYATVPFAIGLLTKWRFPLVWTGLVALSYSHYADGHFQENYWLIALEYSILWAFILWETGHLTVRRS